MHIQVRKAVAALTTGSIQNMHSPLFKDVVSLAPAQEVKAKPPPYDEGQQRLQCNNGPLKEKNA
ncbi:unnamed protein product [marine sediment metagenome]|uniref:Uncharacterized protein n=1 Tax=marine sediment metagenome TaxID=412755 RepID=X0T0N4_9ZZZZ